MSKTLDTINATANLIYCQYENNEIRVDYKIQKYENNWAFIDMQNFYQGVNEQGWNIKWERFRHYLAIQLKVTKAVAFMGYIKEYRWLYNRIRNAGFEIEFRSVKRLSDGTIDGGNVDADLASYVMDYKSKYDKAVIIADDGDYCTMIKSLNRQNKLKLIISSHKIKNTSDLIKKELPREMIMSIHSIRNHIENKIALQ